MRIKYEPHKRCKSTKLSKFRFKLKSIYPPKKAIFRFQARKKRVLNCQSSNDDFAMTISILFYDKPFPSAVETQTKALLEASK